MTTTPRTKARPKRSNRKRATRSTSEVVRWIPKYLPAPKGWRDAAQAPGHHSRYSKLIVKL